MPRKRKKHTIPAHHKTGQEPGTVFFVGSHSNEEVHFRVFIYNAASFEEHTGTKIHELLMYLNTGKYVWIDVHGIHNTAFIEAIGTHYKLHPLVLEDIVNTEHRPKAEPFETYMFLVLKMLSYNKQSQTLEVEHLSLVFGANFVITFQESKPGDPFEPIRNQIRTRKERIVNAGPDFLAYSLIDVITDDYFNVLECQGDKIEEIENSVLARTDNNLLREVYRLKREMMFMRKSVWPIREIISVLQRNENEFISKNTIVYLRDVYDHTVQLIDSIELYRDMLAGSIEIYLSSTSYRLNAVMKVLTVISTIFIPLTFITSIYGMNFEFMPELRTKYGYFFVWGVMILAASGMLYYFKKKRWY